MLPEEQLQRLYVAGFDLQTFERFPQSRRRSARQLFSVSRAWAGWFADSGQCRLAHGRKSRPAG